MRALYRRWCEVSRGRERFSLPPWGSEQDEVSGLRCVRSVALVVPARPGVRAILRDAPPVQDEVADDLQDVVVVQVGRPVADGVEPRGLEHRVAAVTQPSIRCGLPLAGVVLQHRPPHVARGVGELNHREVGGVCEADERDVLGVVGGGHGRIVPRRCLPVSNWARKNFRKFRTRLPCPIADGEAGVW